MILPAIREKHWKKKKGKNNPKQTAAEDNEQKRVIITKTITSIMTMKSKMKTIDNDRQNNSGNNKRKRSGKNASKKGYNRNNWHWL